MTQPSRHDHENVQVEREKENHDRRDVSQRPIDLLGSRFLFCHFCSDGGAAPAHPLPTDLAVRRTPGNLARGFACWLSDDRRWLIGRMLTQSVIYKRYGKILPRYLRSA
ncbi:hypothetical protein SAMN05216404_11820 [Nitrosospira multiformis]|uniref:Uncharacterized protein n=1 Tax=Nitrosospira multiformis TaxID=1231 RepID=A0A1H8NYC7_9PROT|nr:hypothetical protein [Nitrosospira multiformis]SEO34597.1 hypothetical protein SAMN05216404_11820 [Nitrosospira multiformis]